MTTIYTGGVTRRASQGRVTGPCYARPEMINLDATFLLFIEPRRPPSAEPLLDEATQIMTAALRRARPGAAYSGSHACSCGARSTNTNYHINRLMTNALCVHYLAHHRLDVPMGELIKVQRLVAFGKELPSPGELHAPRGRGTAKPKA